MSSRRVERKKKATREREREKAYADHLGVGSALLGAVEGLLLLHELTADLLLEFALALHFLLLDALLLDLLALTQLLELVMTLGLDGAQLEDGRAAALAAHFVALALLVQVLQLGIGVAHDIHKLPVIDAPDTHSQHHSPR